MLGTSKRSVDSSFIEKEIGFDHSKTERTNQEELFLDLLAQYIFYLEAGRLPQKIETNEIPENKAADHDFIDAKMEAIFHKINKIEGKHKVYLLEKWLDVVLSGGNLIPMNIIGEIIKFPDQAINKISRKFIQALNEKGKWFVHLFNPDLIALFEAYQRSTQNVWEEGSSKNRQEYFRNERKKDKKAALDLLTKTWNHESIKDKVQFLNILQSDPDLSDLAFLENLYEEEFRFADDEKKMQRQARNILAETLLMFPESRLFKKTMQSLSPYLTNSDQGLFTKLMFKKKFGILVPLKSDGYWNPETMNILYGFDDQSPEMVDFKADNLYYFSRIVRSVSMTVWCKLFDADTLQTMDYFLKDEQFIQIHQGHSVKSLLEPLIQQARITKDQKLILYLLTKDPDQSRLDLASLLKQIHWENFIEVNALFFNKAVIKAGFLENENEWTEAFSTKLINVLVQLCKRKDFFIIESIEMEAIKKMPVSCIKLLKDIDANQSASFSYKSLWDGFYHPLIESLEIKSLLS